MAQNISSAISLQRGQKGLKIHVLSFVTKTSKNIDAIFSLLSKFY